MPCLNSNHTGALRTALQIMNASNYRVTVWYFCYLVSLVPKRTMPMLDRCGGVITSLKGELVRWEEHFAELLNHTPPIASTKSPSEDEPVPTYERNCDTSTVDEIAAIIQILENNKSPLEDALPPGVF